MGLIINGKGTVGIRSNITVGQNTPSIVTDGLKLYLDAGNPSSYPGTGTLWYDISNNGNNGTLTNGPTYNSSNGGSIVFDGSNDFVDNVGGLSSFSFVQNTNIFSVNIWFKITDLTRDNIILGSSITTLNKGFYIQFIRNLSATYGNYNIFCGVTNGGGVVSVGATNDNTITNSNWINACYVINNSTSGQWYLNGTPVFTSMRGQTGSNIKSTGDSTRTLNIGRGNYISTIAPLNGNISNVQIYNRALSASEVLQNYNALKGRFGL